MQLGLFHYITLLLLISPSLVISQYVDHEKFHPNSNPLFMGISFAVATTLVVVIFIILNICCRQHIQVRVRADDGQGKPAGIGLDPSVLKTFPVFKYSEVKAQRADTGPLECAVCLSPLEVDDDEEEELRLLPKCSHVFHVECVDPWLQHHTTCPLCRTDLVPESDKSTQPNPGQVPELGSREEIVLQVNDSADVLGLEEGQLGKLKRCKSTGHMADVERSDGECWKRFTLNLPEDKMKKLGEEYVKLQRSRSS